MSCTQSQIVMLLEYIERRISNKMKRLGLSDKIKREIIMEIEKIKQNIIEYGLSEIEKQLGI